MTSPITVSLQVPYADTEQQFLVLAVQIAVRTFRSMNARSGEHSSSSLTSNTDPPPSASQVNRTTQTKEALRET
jgi:hypothetical protein